MKVIQIRDLPSKFLYSIAENTVKSTYSPLCLFKKIPKSLNLSPMKKIIFVITLVSMFSAFAVSEKEYERSLSENIFPYFRQHFVQDQMQARDGVTLKYAYSLKPNAIGNLVLVIGWDESYLKYQEVFYDLKDLNYNVFVYDHRGQGLSEHLLADSQKPYIGKFNDYVVDLKDFVETVVVPRSNNLPNFLLSHSMGGCVTALALPSIQKYFKKALFVSPMWRINTEPYPAPIAFSIVGTVSTFGGRKSYAIGKGPYNPNEQFSANTLTHSEPRWVMNRRIQMANPEILLGGPTNQWVHQSLKGTYKVDNIMEKITLPVRVLQADEDHWVKRKFHPKYCARMKECSVKFFPGTFHEILMEKDEQRDIAISEIKEFLK